MPGMRRGTTPTLRINIDQDLTGCWYRVILSQANSRYRIVKKDSQCTLSEDGKTIDVFLSQEETYLFDHDFNLKVQVRYGLGEKAFATNIVRMSVYEILEDDVIE